MDTIPPEILAHIFDYFPEERAAVKSAQTYNWRPELAQYSTVSRAWKASIERRIFKELAIATDELDTFAALFDGENISRREFMTSLDIVFILPPPHNPTGCCAVVRTPDRSADSAAFSASVIKLFTILADLAARAPESPPLSLTFFKAYRVSKSQEPRGTTDKVPCMPPVGKHQHRRRRVLEAKAVHGQFELIREDSIPMVHGIGSFQFRVLHDLQDLRPTWIPAIVKRLPSLERLLIDSKVWYNAGRRRRHAQREDIAASIRSMAGDHLRELVLDIDHHRMENESSPVHKFVNNSHQESCARMLKHLASLPSLTVFRLRGGLVICPEFFQSIANYSSTPYPSLVEFELHFAPETADGRWFYQRDDDVIERSRRDPEYEEFWDEKAEYEDMEERRASFSSLDSYQHVRVFEKGPFRTGVVFHDCFRSMPDKTVFLPFLIEASKAASRIPKLRSFLLRMGNMWHEAHGLSYPDDLISRMFELCFLKAGTPRTPRMLSTSPHDHERRIPGDVVHLHQNRLYWRTDGWTPWDEVQAAWAATTGPDAKTVFLEEKNWVEQNCNPRVYVYEGEL